MSATSKIKSFLAFCARSAGSLFCAVLGLLLVVQCVLLYGIYHDSLYVLPEFAGDYVRGQIEESGVACRFRKLAVRPSGYLEVEDLEIGPPGASTPNFAIKRAAVTVDTKSLLHGKVVPRRIFVENATFFCPPPASPDGKQQVVLGDIRAVLRKDAGGWVRVETLQARYGEMPIVIHGEFIPPELPETSGAVTSAEWGALNQIANRMLAVRGQLEALGKLSLEVAGNGDSSGAVVFSVRARGDTLRLPIPGVATVHGALLAGTIRFDGTDFHPGRDSQLTVQSASWEASEDAVKALAAEAGGDATTAPTATTTAIPAPPRLTLTTGPLRLVGIFGKKWEVPTRVRLYASNVAFEQMRVEFLRGSVRWDNFPQISAKLFLASGGDSVEVRGDANWNTRTTQLEYLARLTPSRYLTHPKVSPILPARLKSLVVHQGLLLRGSAEFADWHKFKAAQCAFDFGAAHFSGINVLHGTGNLRITPDELAVTNADLRAANYWGKGGFSTSFASNGEFRVLLEGKFDPHLLNPFLGAGWTEIWNQIGVRQDILPQGGVDVWGSWGTPTEFIYVGAGGENISFRGVEFDHAELRVAEIPGAIALFDMDVRLGTNQAGGTLQVLDQNAPRKQHESIRMNFSGTLPKPAVVKLVGGSLPTLLEPLHPEQPVNASVIACIHGTASPTPEREQVAVKINIPGNFTAWGQPLADFTGAAAFDTGLLRVTIDEASYAGGKIGGEPPPWATSRKREHAVWVETRREHPRLTFDLELLNAKRGLFLENLQKFGQLATASNPKPPPVQTEKPAEKTDEDEEDESPLTLKPDEVDTSRLDLVFAGSITPPDFKSLDATGTISLKDPAIPRLHIFGGLSRALEKVKIGFTSFKLDLATSHYTVRHGFLFFPDINVTGGDAEINAKGDFDIFGNKLNFVAALDSKAGEGVPVVRTISHAFNKWTNLALVRITGPLNKPKWTLDPSPTGLFRDVLKNETIGTAPPPPTPTP